MRPNFFNAIPIAAETTNFLLNSEEKKKLLNLNYLGSENSAKVSIDSKILEQPSFNRIKNFILNKADEYRENILSIENKLKLTQSWSTVNKKGSFHHKHTHPNAFISMVYYVDCEPDSLNGDIVFLEERSSIQKGFNFNFKIKKHNEFNSREFSFRTKPGFIVLFPGHLLHYSTEHRGDKDRIIIGANFFVEGNIGSHNNTDQMEIKIL